MQGINQYAIGLDLGQTSYKGGIIDSAGKVFFQVEEENNLFTQPESALTILFQFINSLQNNAAKRGLIISTIGISSTVDVDNQSGKFRFINLDAFKIFSDISIRDKFQSLLKLPVIIENDGIAAAWGEYRAGAAKGYMNLISITLGTGIGGGVILNGQLLPETVGSASYFGHMCIDINGPKDDHCPNYGCWEMYVSGLALEKRAKEIIKQGSVKTVLTHKSDGKLIIEAAQKGDLVAIGLLKEQGEFLGVGLVNLLNIFNPEIVVIGGGLSNAGELILQPAREVISKRRMPLRSEVKIVLSTLGKNSGVIGAGLMAMESLNKP
jgi:glucokinase